MVDPDTVIPVGFVVLGGDVELPGSSLLTQEVKNEIPNDPITAAKPTFSKNCLLDTERLPDCK